MELDKIWCEDCISGMDRLSDGSVDMILCDPPYGTTNNFWNKRLPMSEMWRQFKRVTKENAAIVLFSQLPFAVDLINANRKMFRYEWIWHKSNPVGFLNANKMPLRAHENILVFYRKLPTYNPQWWYSKPYVCDKRDKMWRSVNYGKKGHIYNERLDGRRNPIDIIKTNEQVVRLGHPSEHGTRKPESMFEYLIKTYTNAGELVLDACMGSGTTAVAAIKTGRHFVGFEKHEPFVEISERRIKEARLKCPEQCELEMERAGDAMTDTNVADTVGRESVEAGAQMCLSMGWEYSAEAMRGYAIARTAERSTERAEAGRYLRTASE